MSEHTQHDHSGHNHGDMVSDFKKRFLVSINVTIPILALSPMIQSFIGVDWRFSYDYYILFLLSTFVFLYGCCPFITGSKYELKDKKPRMMIIIL